MSRSTPLVVWLASGFWMVLGGCHRGGNGPTGTLRFGATSVVVGEEVALDATLRVEFEAAVEPASLTANAAFLLAVDGPGTGVPARGTWRVAPPAAIEFVPDLAIEPPALANCGLIPDTVYELVVVGGDVAQALRAVDGRPLAETVRQRFTARGTLAHAAASPARLTGVDATPRAADGRWGLGGAAMPAVLRVHFDGPLDPATVAEFSLRYDDPVYGSHTAIDVHAELERNTREGAVVALRPRGVLPSAAQVRLEFASTVRDIDGRGALVPESPIVVATATAYEPQFDALVFEFTREPALGVPDFPEVPAIVDGGALRVPDAFPEVGDVGDWAPTSVETVLRTDTQTLQFQNGRSATFAGGVLKMKSLHIAQGQFVRALGPNPLVLVVDGDAVIDGVLSGDGTSSNNVSLAQYRGAGDVSPPSPGPGQPPSGPPSHPEARVMPGPGGGAGGQVIFWATAGQVAGGPPQGVQSGGGGAGVSVCAPVTEASAGGGGGGSVRGDPWFPSYSGSPTFVEALGAGASNSVAGGAAGEPWFLDADPNNDHWGRAYIPREHRSVVGELGRALGGGGGGTGGSLLDQNCNGTFYGLPGNGGGGGGVIVLQVRGRLVVGSTGAVHANGGDGWAKGNYLPYVQGGGGGGAGGSLVLMAGGGIELHARGEIFANRDYDFVLAADGGVSRGSAGWLPVQRKYPANGQPVFTEADYHTTAFGGFGGMGAIQLMVPVGTSNADGTNTVLDDAITIVRNGIELTGSEKQRYLGWRGFADEHGVFVDDFGVPTGTIGGQGDMRPDPILMPCPFTTHGSARARSTWLPLGGLSRRPVTAPDGFPRAVVGEGLTFAPIGDAPVPGTEASPQVAIAAVATDAVTFGRELQALRLAVALPGGETGAYAGRLAVFSGPVGGDIGRARVVASMAGTLFFEPTADVPATGLVQLFDVGADLPASTHAHIGFAFHRDPEHASASGFDPQRYPPDASTFLFDLGDPEVRAVLRAFRPRYVQWDARLDGPGVMPRFYLPVRF